ncbi:MAG: gliding motility-associated C-terminal domain-containing protein [Crocinitomicaceae bacterium]|nr:gliding motility-associated C-terminal domain-containing protein [Crocinitomicaceae bacterium]
MKLGIFRLSLLLIAILPFTTIAQRGKNLDYTPALNNTVVNTYTTLSVNAAAGANTITVANNVLTNAVLTAPLAPGDLILIIQMQGAYMDIDNTPTVGFGGNYTTPFDHTYDGLWQNFINEWGQVLNPNNAGKFEQAEVRAVGGTTSITLQCNLVNSYAIAGKVQILRIPRFNNLTVNTNTSIVPSAWNGTTGGIVAVEVNGTLTINGTGKISASALGFRGGLVQTSTSAESGVTAVSAANTNPTSNGSSFLGSNLINQGARKGEGIGGYATEYALVSSEFGRGAPANGGGGGGIKNAGGGGGANVGAGTYTGKGVPNAAYAAAWTQETGMGVASSGGGRGGYSYSTSDQNATSLGPNQNAWGGDKRKSNGGLGGHPLVYDATRLYMGGGGGAGESDNAGQGGAGGTGGGIVFITTFGTITGNGSIEADGAAGQKTNPSNQTPGFNQKRGNDGAGGAGAGGSIYIKNTAAIPATLSINARGGVGGNHDLLLGTIATSEATGPGGGGGGGNIAFTSGTPVQTVTGGLGGTSNSAQVTEFPPNGATGGAAGVPSLPTTAYNITASGVSICGGNSTTLTASSTGTLPGTLTWYDAQFGGSVVGSGTTFNTPVLATTTTYYVGTCPGTFRVPVTVTVNPAPVISGTPVITNAGCTTPGGITGLTVSGGSGSYTYTWNATTTPSPVLSNASAGSYTLTVLDANGCSTTSGPYVISGTSGPTINSAAAVVSNQLCNGTMGSITGLTTTGTIVSYTWTNSGGSVLNPTGLPQGAYSLTVTDNVGCTATAGPFNVGFVAGPTINSTNVVLTDELCNGTLGSISGLTTTGTIVSYIWTNSGGSVLNPSALTQGTYSITVTDNNGCTASAGPFTIGYVAGPTLNATNVVITDEICNGTLGTISGITSTGTIVSYTWTGSTSTLMNPTDLTQGAYTLTATDNLGCQATAGPFTVGFVAGPSVNSTNAVVSNELCNGTLGSISGLTTTGNGLTYNWISSGSPASGLNPTNLTQGTYVLTVTDNNGCAVNAGPFTVNFVAGPTINSTNVVVSDQLCNGTMGSISGLTTTGTIVTYAWSNSGGSVLNPTGLSQGAYNLIVTDNNGCTASAGPFNVGFVAGPTVDATNAVTTDQLCNGTLGSIAGLTTTGTSLSYLWTNSGGAVLNPTSLTAGTYSLTVTNGIGCTASAGPFTINFVAGPTVNATNVVVTDVACDGTLGSIAGLTATGSSLTYLWTNSGGSVLNPSSLAAGTYSLTVTDGNGCTANAGPFTVDPSLALSIDNSAMVVTQTSCTANTGSITGIVINGGTNPTISWSNGPSTANISNLAAGTYVMTVSDAAGCTDQLSVDITMVNAPVIDISNLVVVSSHCAQSDGSISGITVSGGTPAYAYLWNGNAALSTLDISSIPAGAYNLVVTDSQGCSDSETVTITDIAGPSVSATNLVVTQPTCAGPGQILGLTVSGVSTPYTYTWTNTTQTTIDITALNPASYTLTVTDNAGCTVNYGPIVLNNPAGPTANFTWNPFSPDVNETITFNNTTAGVAPLVYSWTIDGQTFSTENISYAFGMEGTYPVTLSVIDANGCVDDITQLVSVFGVLVIPNVITPNNDGNNDLFVIEGLKPESKLLVVNRWGNVVFETDDYQNDWNGKDLNGLPLLDGVYTYTLTTPDDNVKHGFIHLIR